LIDLKILKQI